MPKMCVPKMVKVTYSATKPSHGRVATIAVLLAIILGAPILMIYIDD